MPRLKEDEIVTDENGRPVILGPSVNNSTEIRDASWVRNAFMARNADMTDPDVAIKRFWSTAHNKFTDTSVGGNIGLNPWPQFTQYADPPIAGRYVGRQEASVTNTSGNYGMGQYYSGAIDDTKHLIYLRYGLPQYNSLFRFISLAIDRDIASLANTGERYVISETIGTVLGTVLSLVRLPVLALTYWGIRGAAAVLPNASSKYYTLKPTPVLYYSSVTSLFNALAIHRGVLPPSFMSNEKGKIGEVIQVDQSILDQFRKLMPDVFTDKNYIDVYAIMGRAQRIANNQYDKEIADLGSGNVDYAKYVDDINTAPVTPIPPGSFEDAVARNKEYSGRLTLSNPDLAFAGPLPDTSTDEGNAATIAQKIKETIPRVAVDPLATEETEEPTNDQKSWFSKAADYYSGFRKDGADFVPLIVEHNGTVTESFSTSVKDNPISSIVNTTSESSRSIRIALGGNPLGDGAIGSLVDTVIGSVSSIAMSTLNVLTVGTSNIVAALLGGGYIDVPKTWDNSTISLPKSTYTINLVQPYGHPLALLLHTDLIIATMLAGVLPLATGKASYTSPFICELIDPGRQQIPIGIIDSLSISRGTTNLGFNKENMALGVTITFSVLDLSSIMAMPVSDGSTALTTDDDNILSKYISTLAGRSVSDQYYFWPASKVRIASRVFDRHAYSSPAGWAMSFNYSAVGRLINMFSARSDVIK